MFYTKEEMSSTRYYGEDYRVDLTGDSAHSFAVKMIGSGKNVLEVGTSTGIVSRELQSAGNIVTGIEIDADAAEIARQYCDRMIVGDIEEIDLESELGDQRFDVIVFTDLLEHLKWPDALLKRIVQFLKEDGYFVVSLPNFFHGDVLLNLFRGDFHYHSDGILDYTHLRFFGLENVYALFSANNLEIIDLKRVIVPVGSSNIAVKDEAIPPAVLNLIRSMADTDVHQYVFRAKPVQMVPPYSFARPSLSDLHLSSDVSTAGENNIVRSLTNQVEVLEKKNREFEKKKLDLEKKNQEFETTVHRLTAMKRDLESESERIIQKNQALSDEILILRREREKWTSSVLFHLEKMFQDLIVEPFFTEGTWIRRVYSVIHHRLLQMVRRIRAATVKVHYITIPDSDLKL